MRAPPSNVIPPLLAWRLEAFDLRAGLAFATFRSEQTEMQEVEDWPCLFFSPPNFAPETIDNVAAALAATRGSFDAGLIVDGSEAAFKTPEDVAEFVRRAYVSSASGDGSDAPGGGSAPMPPSPEGPREPIIPQSVEEEWDVDSGAGESLRRAIRDFVQQIRGSGQGASFSADWSGILDSDPVKSLGRGALHVIAELLDRFPGAYSTDLLRWLEDVRLLGSCISGLGLWELISVKHEADLSRQVQILRRRTGWDWADRVDDRAFAALLFASQAVPDSAAAEALHWLYQPYLIPVPITSSTWTDPLEALGRMPLPAFASTMAPSDLAELASIEHLLVGFVATPWALLTQLHERESRAALDMLVFAATCVAALQVSTTTQSYLAWMAPDVSILQMQVIRQAGAKGIAWLAEQLPVRGFSAPVEDRILESRDIRYLYGKASSEEDPPRTTPGSTERGA
jgi:hypothetical protein